MSQIELVGGPHDGQLVPDFGPRFRQSAPRQPVIYYAVPKEIAHLDVPTFHDRLRVLEYERHIDSRDLKPRYVFRGEA